MGGSGRTPYATEVHDTSQKSARNPNVTPSLIVVHHAATTSFGGVVTMELGTKQVSSTVVIKDDECASMFDEAFRAWSLSSQQYDSLSLSSETCNSGGADQGWPISEKSYVTLAKVIAEWCRKYKIPADREHIIGHREVYTRYGASYATACPGGIDLDRLVRMVVELLKTITTASTTPVTPILLEEETDMKFYRIDNPKGGLNGTMWVVTPTRIAVFEDAYWATRMAGRWEKKIESISESDFLDEVERFGLARNIAGGMATGGVSYKSWPVVPVTA